MTVTEVFIQGIYIPLISVPEFAVNKVKIPEFSFNPQDCILQHLLEPEAGPEGSIGKY